MKVTLIATTYNWKDALHAVMLSVFHQTKLPDEFIVADDGSRSDTKELIDKLKLQSPLPVKHIWQEDNGFQASKIRNKAIAAAKGDYIIMIDGDMVLESHFVEDHLDAAEKGCFVQGGRVITGPNVKDTLIKNPLVKLSFFSRDIKNRKNTLRSSILSCLRSDYSVCLTGIKTCNFAVWRSDVLSVNGFNESFVGWGREDSEFAVRLMNKKVKRKNLKHKAVAYHLYHPEYSRNNLSINDELLLDAIKQQSVTCEKGINQYLD